jgi:enoyl-CoA hydratase/carnithine racemase
MERTYETLELERIDDHVLLVRLNRPQAANAMNTRMGEELMDLFERFQVVSEGVRAIVLTGSGEKAFCAGGDLKERNAPRNNCLSGAADRCNQWCGLWWGLRDYGSS